MLWSPADMRVPNRMRPRCARRVPESYAPDASDAVVQVKRKARPAALLRGPALLSGMAHRAGHAYICSHARAWLRYQGRRICAGSPTEHLVKVLSRL